MIATKHPAEAYTFTYDFAAKLAGATIVTAAPATSTPRGGGANLVSGGQTVSGTDVLVFWKGGDADEDYATSVTVTTNDGSTLVVGGTIEVRVPKLAPIERGPWTQADLLALSAALANGLRSVTFADGRKTEYQSAADMLAVRDTMKNELAQAAVHVGRRQRFIIARVGRR